MLISQDGFEAIDQGSGVQWCGFSSVSCCVKSSQVKGGSGGKVVKQLCLQPHSIRESDSFLKA